MPGACSGRRAAGPAAAWALAVLGHVACGGAEPPDVTPSPSASPLPVSSLPLQIDDPVVAPETNGSLSVPWVLQARGAARERVAFVDVRDNAADMLVDGAPHQGIAYQAHPGYAGYDLYDVLSVATDGGSLAVTYLYCRDGALASVWALSYSQPLSMSPALEGTCSSSARSQPTPVHLPALMALPPARRSGFTITGNDLNLADASGGIVIGGLTYNVYVLTVVDCTTCPGGPWYEVHCLFRRTGEGGFGILYLYPRSTETVSLAYGLMLPTLQRADRSFAARWSGSPVNAVRGWFPVPDEPALILSRPPGPRLPRLPR